MVFGMIIVTIGLANVWLSLENKNYHSLIGWALVGLLGLRSTIMAIS